MSKESKIKLIIKAAIVVILAAIIFLPRCTKAEGLMPNTPDPNASWDDYISANPVATLPPDPTPIPTEEPTRDPFILMGTRPYQDSFIRAYRYTPEVENGNVVYYYQKLTSPFSYVSSAPSQVAISRSQNENWYEYSTEGASGGLPYVLNKQNSLINLVDNYICLQWNVNFYSSQTVGQGLDYGCQANFVFGWTMSAYEAATDLPINSLPVYVRIQRVLDNGVTTNEIFWTNTKDLAFGFSYSINSDIKERKVYSIRSYFYIGLDEDAYWNLQDNGSINSKGPNDKVYYLVASGRQLLRVNIDSDPSWLQIHKVGNWISNAASTIVNGITSIFVPNASQIENWISVHASAQLENDNPVNRYWNAYLTLSNKFINPNYNPDPHIVLPTFSFNVNNEKVTIWEDFDFRLRDADILFSDGTTLFYWVKLVSSIFIVSNLVGGFLYALFNRLYHINFSGPYKGDGSE